MVNVIKKIRSCLFSSAEEGKLVSNFILNLTRTVTERTIFLVNNVDNTLGAKNICAKILDNVSAPDLLYNPPTSKGIQ